MRPRFASALLLVLVILPLAWSQSGLPPERTAAQPAAAAPLLPANIGVANRADEFPYAEPLTPPAIVTRDRPPLTFAADSERRNFFAGSLSSVAGFDDNVLSSYSNRVSDISYLIAPGFEINRTRERSRWEFGYHPGFVVNQRFSERDGSSHNLSLDMSYRLRPHVTLRLRDTFEKTSSFFSGIAPNPVIPGGGTSSGPNQLLITPLAERTGNTSGVDLAYQFSPSSMIGAGGTYYFVNYGNIAASGSTSSALIDTRSLAADGFFAHRFLNRHWLGAIYDFQRLSFDPGYRTDVQRLLAVYSLPLKAHMALSLWAGPEYQTIALGALNPNLPPRWSTAGGGAFSWQGTRASFRVEGRRQISDGGGLNQAVTLLQASADLRYRLATRWTTGFGVAFSDHDPTYSLSSVSGKIRVLSASAGVDYQITQNVALGVQYGRDRQEYTDAVPQVGAANRNRVLLSLSYSFTHPLGR